MLLIMSDAKENNKQEKTDTATISQIESQTGPDDIVETDADELDGKKDETQKSLAIDQE